MALWYFAVLHHGVNMHLVYVAAITTGVAVFLKKPVDALMVNARRDYEYDEYGLSKRKGNYEKL